MTMDAMWVTASTDQEALDRARRLSLAKIACAEVWPVLAASASEAEYALRQGMVLDTIGARIGAQIGEGLVEAVLPEVLASFESDWKTHHEAAVALQEAEEAALAAVTAALQIEAVAWGRRHYEDLASVISSLPEGEREHAANHFATALSGSNPNYRPEQFKSAASSENYRVRGGTGNANYSRGHYQHIADAIKTYPGDRQALAGKFADHFAANNARFDRGRFLKASESTTAGTMTGPAMKGRNWREDAMRYIGGSHAEGGDMGSTGFIGDNGLKHTWNGSSLEREDGQHYEFGQSHGGTKLHYRTSGPAGGGDGWREIPRGIPKNSSTGTEGEERDPFARSGASDETVIDAPRRCDFCGKEAKYDGKTGIGPWANMCEADFQNYGIGLGLGKGQRLVVKQSALDVEAEYKYVHKRGDKWVITQKGTGKVLSTHDSEEEAKASFRAMMRSKHGVQHTAPGGGVHAPYNIRQRDGKWVVVNDLGEVKGTFDSEDEAREQQKALYANVPGASEMAERKHSTVTIDPNSKEEEDQFRRWVNKEYGESPEAHYKKVATSVEAKDHLTCPACLGMGKKWKKDCYVCGGDGKATPGKAHQYLQDRQDFMDHWVGGNMTNSAPAMASLADITDDEILEAEALLAEGVTLPRPFRARTPEEIEAENAARQQRYYDHENSPEEQARREREAEHYRRQDAKHNPGVFAFTQVRTDDGPVHVVCRKCTAGRDPSGGDCSYCDAKGLLSATEAAVKQADGWDQGITAQAFVVRSAETDSTCRHCHRHIVRDKGGNWIDPEAKGDDSIWRETCDSNDTFTAEHEPDNSTVAANRLRDQHPYPDHEDWDDPESPLISDNVFGDPTFDDDDDDKRKKHKSSIDDDIMGDQAAYAEEADQDAARTRSHVYRCPSCNGSGFVPGSNGHQHCRTCWGSGQVKVKAHLHRAVNTDGYGSDRYQRTRHPDKPGWVDDDLEGENVNPGDNPMTPQAERPAGQRAIERNKRQFEEDDVPTWSREGETPRESALQTTANPYVPTNNPYTTQGPGNPGTGVGAPRSDNGGLAEPEPGVIQRRPMTTRPRVKPTGTDPMDSELDQTYMGENPNALSPTNAPAATDTASTFARLRESRAKFTEPPSMASRVAFKVEEIAAGVMATNTGMDEYTAAQVAVETIRRYPGVLGATWQPPHLPTHPDHEHPVPDMNTALEDYMNRFRDARRPVRVVEQ